MPSCLGPQVNRGDPLNDDVSDCQEMSDKTHLPTHDVAVIGLGPVGALLALLLADYGLKVVVFERSLDPVVLPRAVALDGEAMRTFQRIGLANQVSEILQPSREPDQVCFTNSQREILFGSDLAPCGPNGWRDLAFFDQPELEVLLRQQIESNTAIDVRLGWELIGLDTSSHEWVDLRCRETRQEQVVDARARYVLGCDGASSFVRGAAGIEWQSLGYDQDWLVVDIVTDPGADLPQTTMQVCDPHRLTTYVCVKDPNRRWEFQLLPGETREEMLKPKTIEGLLAPWLPAHEYSIRRAAVYQFHAATAQHWRQGRVFLAGDAAHQTPPFLGQGLNTGIRDALNLAWKLGGVLCGGYTDSLLDSYEEEREPQARELVSGAMAIGQIMETLAAREAGRPDPYSSLAPPPPVGAALVPPLQSGLFLKEQLGRPGTFVGKLIRQPTVRAALGQAGPLDDFLGLGFALVGRTSSDLQLTPELRSAWERLGGSMVAVDALPAQRLDHDALFDHHAAALIRPDRYIFGVADEGCSVDRLVQSIVEQLGFSSESAPQIA